MKKMKIFFKCFLLSFGIVASSTVYVASIIYILKITNELFTLIFVSLSAIIALTTFFWQRLFKVRKEK